VDPAEFNGHPTADHGRYEVTRKSTASRSIIAITSHALDGEEQTARAAGCDGYMPEPYSPRQLLVA
jgi:CheY-like chemotaxis protein